MSAAQLEDLLATLKANYDGSQSSRREAYERLEMMKCDAQFSSLLCQIFGAGHVHVVLRQLAGLTLKNNMEAARTKLGEQVFLEAGKLAIGLMDTSTERVIASTAAAIVSRITSVTGLEWWRTQLGVDIGAFMTDSLLQSGAPQRSHLGIMALQYLVEDASHQLGDACGHIIGALADYAVQRAQDRDLADRALATLCNVYEFGQKLDWTVERLSGAQNGLVDRAPRAVACALGYFNEARILDQPGRSETRRLCLRAMTLLVQYLLPDTEANCRACADIADVACRVLCSGIMRHEREVAMEAAEVLVVLLIKSDETQGDGGPWAAVDVVGRGLGQVLEALFEGMTIAEHDMRERLQNDHPNARDRYRTAGLSKRNRSHDVADENADDGADDANSNPLRDVCFRLLTCLSVTLPEPVFNIARDFAQPRFAPSRGWQDKAVALDVLSAVHDGCGDQMSGIVVQLARDLIGVCEQGDQHIAVTAMALHCLGKFFCDFVRLDQPDVANATLALTLRYMQHPHSKYVQCAAVTATKFIVSSCVIIKAPEVLQQHHGAICGAMAACLGSFHTNNFALLCDFAPLIVGLLNEAEVTYYIEMLAGVATARHQGLIQSLGERYFDGRSDTPVQKEYFDAVRALTECWVLCFAPQRDAPLAAAQLQLLVDYTSNLLSSFTPIEDDAELMDWPLHVLRPFYKLLGGFRDVLCPLIAPLPRMLLAAFKRCADFHIRSYALGNLHDILLADASVFGVEDLNSLLMAVNDVYAADNPNRDTCMYQALQADAALALYALSLLPGLPFSLHATMLSVADEVRGDLTEENSYVGSIAQCVGIFMLQSPSIFSPAQAEQAICALRYSAKDVYGAQAFAGVCGYVAGLAQNNKQAAMPLLEDLANLIVAWTSFIDDFDDAKPAVRQVLGACNPVLPRMLPPHALRKY